MNITATHEIFVIFESKIQFPKGEETASSYQVIHIHTGKFHEGENDLNQKQLAKT